MLDCISKRQHREGTTWKRQKSTESIVSKPPQARQCRRLPHQRQRRNPSCSIKCGRQSVRGIIATELKRHTSIGLSDTYFSMTNVIHKKWRRPRLHVFFQV